MSRRLDSEMGTFAIVPRWLMENVRGQPNSSRAIELYAWLWCVYADRHKRRGVATRDRLAVELHTTVISIARAVDALRRVGAITTTRSYTAGRVTGMQFTLHVVPTWGGESRDPKLSITSDPKALSITSDTKSYVSKNKALSITSDTYINCTVPERSYRERGADAPTRALPTPERDSTEDRPPQTGGAKVESAEVFFSAWEARYPGLTADRTPKNVERLTKAISIHGLPTVQAAIHAYLADPNLTDRGHPAAIFVGQIGQLAASRTRGRPSSAIAPARSHVCPHTDDPCASEDACKDRQGQDYLRRQAAGAVAGAGRTH